MRSRSLPFFALTAVGKGQSIVDRIGLAGQSRGMSVHHVTTADELAKMTPDSVLEQMMEGNRRFVRGELSDPDLRYRRAATIEGQSPKAYVLSCIDSRVPVEQVFDQGLGEIFVGRVAGNIDNVDQIGSMEYAVVGCGSKLVMVLGHESCGAVKAACDKREFGNLGHLLGKIERVVDGITDIPAERHHSSDAEFVQRVVEGNVRLGVAEIRRRSEALSSREQKGEIKIVGAVYSLDSGEVHLLC